MDKHEHHSASLSDDSIRRFLLGQLNARERSIFEERLFSDGELELRVRLAEYELADDYAGQRLTESETQSFREKYLLAAGRQQKLEVSQALHDHFSPALVRETRASRWPGLTARLDIPRLDIRPAWRYVFAALILALILATYFLVTKEPQIANFIPHRSKPRPPATATPQSMHHSTNPSSPAHAEQRVPEPPHETPQIASLNANGKMEEAARVTLPAGENALLRFHLSLATVETGVYRADVLTASGEKLFTAETLKPYGGKPSFVDFDIPASVLKSGPYQINLARLDDQARPELLRYYFRIQ